MRAAGFRLSLLLACLAPAASAARADLIPIGPNGFGPNPTVITFETGTTALPVVPGVTFLETSPLNNPFFDGDSTFTSFAGIPGRQVWANTVSTTYSELGLSFATPEAAIGGYIGKIPGFTGLNPSQVVLSLFDASSSLIGTATLTLPSAIGTALFFGFTADRAISRVEFNGNNAGFFGVDNFTFSATVPEPSSLALAAAGASGLLVLAGRARRAGVARR